ncbi:hypothetical protein LJB42_001236 [Komagataella kurtzmanii]|nr:hypothetical protein LJB42_001236 [Komagataella kurtzmanii]
MSGVTVPKTIAALGIAITPFILSATFARPTFSNLVAKRMEIEEKQASRRDVDKFNPNITLSDESLKRFAKL